MGFAPYPGKVSARTVTAFCLVVALGCIAFWAVVLFHLEEPRSLRAWVLLVTGAHVLYWRPGQRASRPGSSEVEEP